MAELDVQVSGEERLAPGDRTVSVDELHVSYRVYEERRPTVGKLVANRFKPRTYREIRAVRGVSFTASAGEAVGLVGRNGSGKSTLLKAIAGLLPAESGQVLARTEPVLLGVGAVLQPNLSGRRNIVLGALALGLSMEEIVQLEHEIIEFSGLEDFIDMPLRTYSTGMRARLHFAIATAKAPDILLIDEILSVGDEEFRHKSEDKLRSLCGEAGTVFFVSHSLEAVKSLCNRVLWLDKGTLVQQGDPETVLQAYTEATSPKKR